MAQHRRPAEKAILGSPPVEPDIEFEDDDTGVRGTGANGRCWRITRAVAGWRLDFRDPGDDESTYAGMFGTRDGAMDEAKLYSTRASLTGR